MNKESESETYLSALHHWSALFHRIGVIVITTLNVLTGRKTPSYLLVTFKFSTSVSTVVNWVLNSLSVLYSYTWFLLLGV